MPDRVNANWLEEVLRLGDNRTLLPLLVRQINEGGIVPFAGAGLSAPYNLPQWSELIKGLAPDAETRVRVEALLNANEYEAAAEYLMDIKGPRQFQLLFRARFEAVEIDLEKSTAVTQLARLGRGPIITTNFDRVIETVLEHEGCRLEVIAGENKSKMSDAFQYGTDTLLKVHGDIQDPEGRVLAKKEYDEAYTRWLDLLLRNVATRCLVFLGCSLKTDRPMQVLSDLVKGGHGFTHHYAILALPLTDEEVRARAKQLSEECHIHVIWYPQGKHEYVARLVEYLADQLRPEFRRNRKRPLFRDIPEGRAMLFGRDPEELAKIIESSHIVSVEGKRGIGKTAFALQALHRFMDRGTFGALAWITASARKDKLQLSHVLDAVSNAIDFPFKPQTSVDEKEAQLADELARKNIRCLLLLDNYETVADRNIEGFLFDPDRLPRNLIVLITMAGRLIREGVTSYRLDELGEKDAAAMFRDRVAHDGLEQPSEESVSRLYKTVGGNPLAIEWVVGTMRCGVELAGFLTKIENGQGDVLSRTLGQIWSQIEAGKRDLLFAFSIFVRPPLEEVLQVASGLEKAVFYDDLDALMRLYLVKGLRMHEAQESQLTGHRYTVHPFARDFFEKQKAGGAAVLYPRMASFYAEYVSERGGTPEKEEEAAVRELNGERENILGVLDGCWKVDAAQVVVPTVHAMARWLFTESHWEDLENYGSRAAAAAVAAGEKHAAARILAEVGRVYSYRSEYDRATETLTRASKLAAAKPADQWAAAYIQHHLGESLTRQKKYREARTILLKSLAGFTRIGSTRSMIGVRYRLAMLAFETNKLNEAGRLAQTGAEDTSRDQWPRMEGFNRRLLGDIAVRKKELEDARFQYGRALKLVPRTDMRIQALIELSLARLEAENGNRDKAREQAAVAASHFEKLRMPREAEEAHRIAAKDF